MGPYYELDDITKKRIFDLISACERSELGNVKFEYWKPFNEVRFSLMALESGWWVTVSTNRKRDIYFIMGDEIVYHHSEKD